MRLNHLIADLTRQMVGRLVRRAIAGLVVGLFAIAAVYQLTAAGTLALGEAYGMTNARLIVAGLFAAAAGVVLAYLFATRAKPPTKPEKAEQMPQAVGIALVLESLLLGLTLARGKPRSKLKRT